MASASHRCRQTDHRGFVRPRGLGSKDGSPVAYEWVLPGVAPLLLPWLAILGLLTLKPNRFARVPG